MIRKPNEGLTNSTRNVKNLIGRQFSKEFRLLTDIGYYEGTKYAEFFNYVDDCSKSNIYVHDQYEEDIEEFDQSPFNEMKYLVGLTGMGKTTLLRNYYRIFENGFVNKGNEYLIYISFYRAELSMDHPYRSLVNEIVSYLSAFAEYLLISKAEVQDNDDTDFWIGLYRFIYKNKPTLVSTNELVPGKVNIKALKGIGQNKELKIKKLKELFEKNKFEYYCCLIKYILQEIGNPYKITFIFDDIESKDTCFHSQMIEIARHIYSCLNATDNVRNTVKMLVVLRAYTFRSNMGRISEARREIIKTAILKKTTVSLHDIFESRFKAVSNNRIKGGEIGNLHSYRLAKWELDIVESKLNKAGEDIIFGLSNNNLCNAMTQYCELLINLEWMTCTEDEERGIFKIDSKFYKVTKNNILRAIGMSNEKFYDGSSELIPNIIQHNGSGSELLCLYIIRYLMNKKIVEIYGEDYVVGSDLLETLLQLFCPYGTPESIKKQWENNLFDAISFLYYKGVLFRSLYDIENVNVGQIKRDYEERFKLYLAPRGKTLYKLLGEDSVLLEIYRDDIEIDLENNDKVTADITKYETFLYIINLLKNLFWVEKRNIASSLSDIDTYVSLIGDEFIVAYLLLGLSKNVKVYYGEQDEYHDIVVNQILELLKDMKEYTQSINQKYGKHFKNITIEKINELLSE